MRRRSTVAFLAAAVMIVALAGAWATTRTSRLPFGFLAPAASFVSADNGGALANVHGELVGMNTAIVSGGGGGNQGVGFAVTANMARTVMDEIQKHGKVIRGSLGVSIQTITPEIAKAFGLTGQPRGALVSDVTPHSPAERSGISKGDVILELNGAQVNDRQELRLKISMMAPGTTAKLKILRDGQQFDIAVTLAEPPAKPESETNTDGQAAPGPRLGISVDQLTPQIARQIGLPPDTKGVVVADLTPGSAAEQGGVQRGDVIEEVDRKGIATTDQFQRAIRQAGNQSVLLLINRGGYHLYLVLPPQ